MARSQRDIPKLKLNRENIRKAFRIFTYAQFDTTRFAIGMLFLLLTAGVAILFPLSISKIISQADSPENIEPLVYQFIGLMGLQAIFSYFRYSLFVEVTEKFLFSLRAVLYRKMIKMPMDFYSERRVGELNSRISTDIAQVQDVFTTSIAEMIRQFLVVIGCSTILIYNVPGFALVVFLVVPVIAFVAVFFGRYVRKFSRNVQDKVAQSNVVVEESLQGIQIVKSFNNEYFEIGRYVPAVNVLKQMGIKLGRVRGAFIGFFIFFGMVPIILMLKYLLELRSEGVITLEQLSNLALLTLTVTISLGGIPEQFAMIQKGLGATDRIMEILEQDEEQIREQKPQTEKLKGQVEFRNVSFAYKVRPDIEVLTDFSMEARPGDTIAIVGRSGAGKSTIASLILNFYNNYTGEIFYDGKNARDFQLDELRSQMSLVPQDVWLFGGTIKENIAYGNPAASDEQINDAARKANALQFISSFPEGMDTVVGERGIRLSGGQKQRIAIARAILKDPAILILDEATSSLDSESEKLVQEALENLMKGRTSFVIAHRLSTIRNADKIIVLEKGKTVEQGTHEELLTNREGLFSRLHALQMF